MQTIVLKMYIMKNETTRNYISILWMKYIYNFAQRSKTYFIHETVDNKHKTYLAATQPRLGHYQGDNLTYPMLIAAF